MGNCMNYGISGRTVFGATTRAKTGARRTPLIGGPIPKAIIDRFTILPILACVFSVIISPLEYTIFSIPEAETRLDTRVFWPSMAAISVVLALQYRSRLRRPLPPHIICLFMYLTFAGASVLWSVNPNFSFIKIPQKEMVIPFFFLPAMLAGPTADMMRGMFLWCFAPAAILNIFFVFENSPSVVAVLKG